MLGRWWSWCACTVNSLPNSPPSLPARRDRVACHRSELEAKSGSGSISHCVFDKRKNHNSWSTKCRQSRFAAFELPKRKVQRQQNSSSVAVWSATRIIRNLLKACTCAYLSTADRPLCSHGRALEPRDPKLFALNLPDSVSFRALLQAFCATRRARSCSPNNFLALSKLPLQPRVSISIFLHYNPYSTKKNLRYLCLRSVTKFFYISSRFFCNGCWTWDLITKLYKLLEEKLELGRMKKTKVTLRTRNYFKFLLVKAIVKKNTWNSLTSTNSFTGLMHWMIVRGVKIERICLEFFRLWLQ